MDVLLLPCLAGWLARLLAGSMARWLCDSLPLARPLPPHVLLAIEPLWPPMMLLLYLVLLPVMGGHQMLLLLFHLLLRLLLILSLRFGFCFRFWCCCSFCFPCWYRCCCSSLWYCWRSRCYLWHSRLVLLLRCGFCFPCWCCCCCSSSGTVGEAVAVSGTTDCCCWC